jgi:nucleobase:cation symporter-1, NCS1 family
MQGPLATTLGNTDFSWLSGGVVAGGLYFVLARRRRTSD